MSVCPIYVTESYKLKHFFSCTLVAFPLHLHFLFPVTHYPCHDSQTARHDPEVSNDYETNICLSLLPYRCLFQSLFDVSEIGVNLHTYIHISLQIEELFLLFRETVPLQSRSHQLLSPHYVIFQQHLHPQHLDCHLPKKFFTELLCVVFAR